MILNTILFILIFFIFRLIIVSRIKVLRQIRYNNLDSIYDKMQMYILVNNVPVTRDLKEFMVRHKIFVENKELCQMDVLMSLHWLTSKEIIDRNVARWNELIKSIDPELMKLHSDLGSNIDSLILMSRYKPSFCLYLAGYYVRAFVRKGIQGITQIQEMVENSKNNESSIAINFNRVKLAA